jgi:hypothetical protein
MTNATFPIQTAAGERDAKPLGRKGYGSIPHLPGSRMGPADHSCHDGQQIICTEKARDKHDRIIVTEKVDGSCVTVAKVGKSILAVNRAGYLCATAPYEQHRLFAEWVADRRARFDSALLDGQRICGEWLAQAHATRYELPHDPFVAFDLMAEAKRLPWDELTARCNMIELPTVAVLSDGPAFSIERALAAVETSQHGAIDPVEGAVWRVERKGEFDFMAKYVRHDKRDGIFLPDISGADAIWNWRPALAAQLSKAKA